MKVKTKKPRKTLKDKLFLCREPGGANIPDELFTIMASDLKDAQQQAAIWNGVVIKEIKP